MCFFKLKLLIVKEIQFDRLLLTNYLLSNDFRENYILDLFKTNL